MLDATTGHREDLVFVRQLPSSPRGAQRARHLAVRHLAALGFPPAADTSATVALVVAELAANAVRHGHVRGRDFELRIAYSHATATIRIEVSDASTNRPRLAGGQDESGRGLLLVGALAARWGTCPRDGVGKTVWAEVPALRPGPWAAAAARQGDGVGAGDDGVGDGADALDGEGDGVAGLQRGR